MIIDINPDTKVLLCIMYLFNLFLLVQTSTYFQYWTFICCIKELSAYKDWGAFPKSYVITNRVQWNMASLIEFF